MILGAWRGTGTKFEELQKAIDRGDFADTIKALSPVVVEKSITAVENLQGKPIRTMYGRPITDEYGRPVKLTTWDTALTLLGFRPMTVAEPSSIYNATETIKKFFSTKRNKIYEKIKFADTYEDLQKILEKDVNDYNMRVAKYGGAIPLITSTSIREVIKRSRGEPNKLALLLEEED